MAVKSILVFDSTGSLKDLKDSDLEFVYIRGANIGFRTSVFKKMSNKARKFIAILPTLLGKRLVVSDAVSRVQTILADEFVFLNHGWGTKYTPPRWKWKDPRTYVHFRDFLKKNPIIVCLSEFDSSYFLRAPGLDPSMAIFLPLGHPRNDFLVRNSGKRSFRDEVARLLGFDPGKRIILYAPTHREFKDINDKVYERIFKEIVLLNGYLDEYDSVLLFRPHYYVEGMSSSFKDLENVRYVGVDILRDPRRILLASDVLITDYSSIYVDYLLLERPVVFYPFDLEDYDALRGLAISFDNPLHTPGPKIGKLVEVLDVLDELDRHSDEIRASKEFFHKHTDDKSLERVIELVREVYESL